GDHVVAVDQLLHRRGRLCRLALVVLAVKLQLTPIDPAGVVDLIHRHLAALVAGLAEGGGVAGHRGVFTDRDRPGATGCASRSGARRTAAACQRETAQRQKSEQGEEASGRFHELSPSGLSVKRALPNISRTSASRLVSRWSPPEDHGKSERR